MSGQTPALSSEQKRELLATLLRGKAAASAVDHPLSYNQRSLWFMHCLARDSSAYNVPFAFRILSPLDVPALRRAFEALVTRHAILRTTYGASTPVQQVHERQDLDFEEIDATAWSGPELRERLVEEAQRPFDLRRGPVLRVRLFAGSGGDRVLLLTFHHIAYDLWSMMTFLTELGSLYSTGRAGTAPTLPAVQREYLDFVRWQADMLASDGDRLWAYWKRQLSGALPVLELPTDRPRAATQSYEGATYRRELPPRLAEQLAALARAEETTLFTVLLAAFQLLLHRHSGQDDILVGSPVAGRSAEFEHVVGYFLNTLPFRADFSGAPTFRAFLGRVRETVHGALTHQDFPVELLVERLRPARSAGHAALYQTMFVMNRLHRLARRQGRNDDADGTLDFERIPLDLQTSQFDLSLEVDDFDDRLTTRWEYNTDLFDEATVARWAMEFEALLDVIAGDPERLVSGLSKPTLSGVGSDASRPAFTAPRTAAEELVAGVVCEVLGLDRAGVQESLFALGCDSFKAAQVASRLVALAGVDLGLAAVFDSRTIERLAGLLEDALLDQAEPDQS